MKNKPIYFHNERSTNSRKLVPILVNERERERGGEVGMDGRVRERERAM